jgi:hypothetical protein
MRILLLIAQSVPTEWFQALLQGGSAAAVLGAIVVWFALRMEKILERLREAMERNTNSLMVSVLNTKHLDDALKPLAEKLERESAEAMKLK